MELCKAKEDCKVLKCIKNFFKKDWSMSEKVLLTLLAVSFGVLMGIFLSPIKEGMDIENHFGCNNWSNNSDIGGAPKKQKKHKKQKESKKIGKKK